MPPDGGGTGRVRASGRPFARNERHAYLRESGLDRGPLLELAREPGRPLTFEAIASSQEIPFRLAHGRDPEHIKVLIHGGPIVAATGEAARRRERETFEEDDDFERSLALLGHSSGAHDFSVHDLDAPFPEVAHLAEKGGRTGAAKIIEQARKEKLTLRRVAEGAKAFRRPLGVAQRSSTCCRSTR